MNSQADMLEILGEKIILAHMLTLSHNGLHSDQAPAVLERGVAAVSF